MHFHGHAKMMFGLTKQCFGGPRKIENSWPRKTCSETLVFEALGHHARFIGPRIDVQVLLNPFYAEGLEEVCLCSLYSGV